MADMRKIRRALGDPPGASASREAKLFWSLAMSSRTRWINLAVLSCAWLAGCGKGNDAAAPVAAEGTPAVEGPL